MSLEVQSPSSAPVPAYDSFGYSDDANARSALELPEYTGPARSGVNQVSAFREQSEHVYYLETANGHSWLKMKVKSWAPSAKQLPMFVEGAPVAGAIELDLLKPDSLKSIVVSVRGVIVSSGMDEKPFFVVSETLWDQSSGNPGDPPGSSTTQSKHTEKLSGRYVFPFSITLPSNISISGRQAKDLGLSGNERLPPSLSGRGWHSFINYELSVHIKRSGTLRVSSSLKTLIGYTPITTPDSLSPLRQQAYQEGTPLLGPEVDPQGWKVLPNVEIRGTIFKARKILARCTLALANPLQYTRGSIIPCMLTISSDDEQALDLLSKPEAPVLQMRRKLKARVGVDDAGAAMTLPGNEENQPISCVSWMPIDGADSGNARVLYGEMTLPPNLSPTFTFGVFDLKYVLDLYPFAISGFAPDSSERVLREEVAIVSAYGNVRPKAILPPVYSNGAARDVLEDTRRLVRLGGFM